MIMTQTAFAAASPRGFTLRQLLGADAATCFVFGLLLVVGAAPLAGLLGLPETLLLYAGVALFPCAGLMVLAARTLAKPLVGLVIAGNVAWIAGSVAVALRFEVTGLGIAFITAQAAAVAALVVLEWRASKPR
jgi:hypothetical protein